MAGQTIVVKTKASQGDRVDVLNYKLRPPRWESGKVYGVSCGLFKDGTYRMVYEVILDRKTTGRSRMFPEGGKLMRLTVGDDGIQ